MMVQKNSLVGFEPTNLSPLHCTGRRRVGGRITTKPLILLPAFPSIYMCLFVCLQVYTDWANNRLKRAGLSDWLITDLQRDVTDGTHLPHIIRAVGMVIHVTRPSYVSHDLVTWPTCSYMSHDLLTCHMTYLHVTWPIYIYCTCSTVYFIEENFHNAWVYLWTICFNVML